MVFTKVAGKWKTTKNNTKCHVGRKEQIEGVHINRKQQNSHGHKFDVTPVLQAAFFE